MASYSVDNTTIEHLLGFIRSGEIAIPEMQRPFVWKGDQIRDLIDSLYHGYPIGYLIIWQNPDMIDKNGEKTIGKKIMIDGQQRITALMTAIVGMEVIDKNFKRKTHKIAFNPYAALNGEKCFEVQSAAIKKDKKWISDISLLFANNYNAFNFVPAYCQNNTDMGAPELNDLLDKVRGIRNAPIGIINLSKDLSIDSVTDIFIRINGKGTSLTQVDFVMSTIAADENYGGNLLRKSIDYYCHLLQEPAFNRTIETDTEFCSSPYYDLIKWAGSPQTHLFNFTYDDILRIAFMSQYHRGKMTVLTDLLHGRNFESRNYEEEIAKDSFGHLSAGVKDVFSKYIYTQFCECLRSAGFIHQKLLRGRMAIDFAYMLFIRLRRDNTIDKSDINHYVRKWYVMSILTGRYATSPETMMDTDLRAIRDKSFLQFYRDAMANISDTFWEITLVQDLETTSSIAPSYNVFLAAQCRENEPAFLAEGCKIRDVLDSADIHHIFPKQYLQEHNINSPNEYNQIANYTYLNTLINIRIGKKAPKTYLEEILTQKITTDTNSIDKLNINFDINCIPRNIINMDYTNYQNFLCERRKLMAKKIHRYFDSL